MISYAGHVWARAERNVSAIHSCALYAGMRMDTSGVAASLSANATLEGLATAAMDGIADLPSETIPLKRLTNWPSGAQPRCSRMTTPRYRIPNNAETANIRIAAPIEPGWATNAGIFSLIRADAQPASSDAAMYFHTAPNTGPIPNLIGRPAYHNAGNVRIQNDAVHAAAIPSAPHGSNSRNRNPVAVSSIMPQRNQRSALPRERWIQP